jgi:hypothetical protein
MPREDTLGFDATYLACLILFRRTLSPVEGTTSSDTLRGTGFLAGLLWASVGIGAKTLAAATPAPVARLFLKKSLLKYLLS